MDDLTCRLEVARVARLLYDRQLVTTCEGNVSLLCENRVYVTPSQVCKGFLTPEQIVVTDRQGKALEWAGKPSSEIGLHLFLYDTRPDVAAVVHTHSPFATAFALACKPIESQGYTEMLLLHGRIPVVSYGAPGTPDIARDIPRYIQETDMLLLANHGVVAVGKTVEEAYEKAETVEALAKTLLFTQLLGGEVPLPPKDREELIRRRAAAGGQQV